MTATQTLNPYAKYLGEREPLGVIEATAAELQGLLEGAATDRLVRSPAPGKWSVRDILCHLADTELAFGFRLRQTLAEDNHVIQPYDQEKHAIAYDKRSATTAMTAFTAIREWNLLLIRAVLPQARSKTVTHPERGTMTFGTIIETMAGHDLNHTLQIEGLLRG